MKQMKFLSFPILMTAMLSIFFVGCDDDDMMDDEDTPGFTLVIASAAIGMAMFVNQRRHENEE